MPILCKKDLGIYFKLKWNQRTQIKNTMLSWASVDRPRVYLQACRAAMGGFRGMAALHACKYTCGQSAGAHFILYIQAQAYCT